MWEAETPAVWVKEESGCQCRGRRRRWSRRRRHGGVPGASFAQRKTGMTVTSECRRCQWRRLSSIGGGGVVSGARIGASRSLSRDCRPSFTAPQCLGLVSSLGLTGLPSCLASCPLHDLPNHMYRHLFSFFLIKKMWYLRICAWCIPISPASVSFL